MSGQVIWITGLSSAGKTTVAKNLAQDFIKHNIKPILLDGDELRAVLKSESKGFDYEGRKELSFTYARFAKLLADQGHTVIVATISLFHDVHTWNREHFLKYTEVFLDISEEERRKRDPKGLYKAQQNGTNPKMAGVDLLIEFPLAPDIHIQEEENCENIIKKIKQKIDK